MQFHQNELFIYLDPNSSVGKKTRAYASSISKNVNALDSNKIKLTATLWKEIVNMLNLRPKDLMNRAHPEYQEKIRGNTFTMTGWLEILAKNPQLLKAPIAIYHNKAIMCERPTDILTLDEKSRRERKVLPHLKYYS
ncbi:MAG: glutaredoxin [Cyclobacteriaceae bacterium]|nr:glutaredoxin [Cyclobacteriaceae bacterium]